MRWLTYHEEPITLSSGDQSHWFVDARKIYEDRQLREQVLSTWERRLDPNQRWHFLAVPRGGIPWASALAGRMDDATWGIPPGIPVGAHVVAVEDVVTTGRSIKRVSDSCLVKEKLAVVVRDPGALNLVTCTWAVIDLRPAVKA